jgi:hypothetical protein
MLSASSEAGIPGQGYPIDLKAVMMRQHTYFK